MRHLLVVAAAALLAPAASPQDKPKEPPAEKPKEPAPDTRPVLGPDTVAATDLAYGKDPKQTLDLYRPKGAKNAPVVVYVHGGEWMKGDKAEVSFKPKFFTENGFVFASVNYRLSPAAKHPAHVSDVAAAVRWVRDHAAEYGGDPKRVVLMGHSAGCHLVALTALDPQHLAAVGLKPADLRAVVAWSGGSFDLVHKATTDAAFAKYITDAFGPDESAWRAASPLTHAANAQGGPPYLFVTADPAGDSFRVAKQLVDGITAAGGRAETLALKDRTHRTANHLLGSPGDTTGAALLDFLGKVTK